MSKSFYYRKAKSLYEYLQIFGVQTQKPRWIGTTKQYIINLENIMRINLNAAQSKWATETIKYEEERKEEKQMYNRVNEFVNNNNMIRIYLSPKTKDQLKNIIDNLNIENEKYIIEINKKFYVLNKKTADNIINLISKKITLAAEDSSSIIVEESITGEIMIEKINKKVVYDMNDNEGSKFRHININSKFMDLSRYQIAGDEQQYYSSKFNENCFVYALRMSGKVSEENLDSIKSLIKDEYIQLKKIEPIAKEFDLYITVHKITSHKDKNHYGKKDKSKEIKLGLIDKHYFIIEKTQITKRELTTNFEAYHDKSKCINSYALIKYIVENKEKYLKQPDTKKNYNSFINDEEEINLNYSEKDIKPVEFKENNNKYNVLVKNIFFDFETTTEGEKHIPYLLRCDIFNYDFIGPDAGRNMLEEISKRFDSVKLIAHNITYDFRFLYKYLMQLNLIERGSKLMHGSAIYKNKAGKVLKIQLQDSYSLIPMKLKEFSASFGLEQEKEIMPYHLYTQENIKRRFINIEEFKNIKDFETFKDNCNKWGVINNAYEVDIIKYSSHYCAMDVEVLKNGYNKFRQDINNICGLDVNNYISIASIANAYMEKSGAYEGVFKITRKIRDFIGRCVVGGRVMTRNNEKIHIKENIQDFDAVSLYPSAMERLSRELGGYLKGTPKVLLKNQLNQEFLNKCDGYFIFIKVLSVGKNYNFPLASQINKETGSRIFTNDLTGKKLYVDKIALEDLIKYQNITFEVIRGYYFNQGRNNRVGEIITQLFNERLKAKANKNPVQNVYKLLMNSSYGKTLLKPYEVENHYIDGEKAQTYLIRNFEHIRAFDKMETYYDITRFQVYTSTDEHYNICHVGIEILSMSKRIMNEVMTLAEDKNYNIYYQDTDSMHISADKVELLAKDFKDKYGRDLIGSNMGQFHSDFNSDIIKKNIKSVELIALGKKSYIDKLEGIDKNGNTVNDYHIRMKGISNEAILKVGSDPMKIYERLYKGESIRFDLTVGGEKACFEFKKDGSISTKYEFYREVKFN